MFCKWKFRAIFNFLLQNLGSLKFDFSEKNSSHFMESKNTINFEAKTEQKINYPADFGGLSRAVGKFFWPGTNFICSAITKLKFWVYLEPPRISTSGGKLPKCGRGGIYAPPPAWNRVKISFISKESSRTWLGCGFPSMKVRFYKLFKSSTNLKLYSWK